jgi:hypothetical protein
MVQIIIGVSFLIIGLILLCYKGFYSKTEKFCQKTWIEDRENRHVFVSKIINEKKLIGLSKNKIEALLGLEFNDPYSNFWTYYAGVKPGFFTSKTQHLRIYFNDNSKVYLVMNKISQ